MTPTCLLAPFGLAFGLVLLATPVPAQDLGGIVGQALEGLTGRSDDRRDDRRFEDNRDRRGLEAQRQDMRERERDLRRRERAEERRHWEREQRRRQRAQDRHDERPRYKVTMSAPAVPGGLFAGR